jgi:hypothetical protein
MLLGYMIAAFFSAQLATKSNLTVASFTMLLFGVTLGLIMTDVMADALLTCKAKTEHPAFRGQLQAAVYMIRFLTEMFGYWCGSIISNVDTWGWGLTMPQCFTILTLLPIFIAIPSICFMDEPILTGPALPARDQMVGIWKMMQLRATWQPLAFLVLYNTLHPYNAAWGNYLQVAYHFNAFEYGSMAAFGSTVAFVGVYIYKRYFLSGGHWRFVYIFASIVIALFSFANILLVFRVNDIWGLPPYWFALGDSAIQKFAVGLQYLPSAIMFVRVCPDGQEAVAFSLLTGFTNLSGGFASTMSNALLGLWPVQLEDLRNGDFSGVWKLTLLTSCIRLVSLALIPWLLPNNVEELDSWKHPQYTSRRCGFIALSIYGIGFFWVIILSVVAIVSPCSPFVGGNGCPP